MVADELKLPMDIVAVRKIQITWNPEAGFGAFAWDDEIFLNESLVKTLNLTEKMIREAITKTLRIIRERMMKFRGTSPLPNLKNKTAILIDDGLATGYTMIAATNAIKKEKPRKVIVAVPTGSSRAVERLATEADEVICLNIRSSMEFAVADAYQNWYDVDDEEVVEILKRAEESHIIL